MGTPWRRGAAASLAALLALAVSNAPSARAQPKAASEILPLQNIAFKFDPGAPFEDARAPVSYEFDSSVLFPKIQELRLPKVVLKIVWADFVKARNDFARDRKPGDAKVVRYNFTDESGALWLLTVPVEPLSRADRKDFETDFAASAPPEVKDALRYGYRLRPRFYGYRVKTSGSAKTFEAISAQEASALEQAKKAKERVDAASGGAIRFKTTLP